MVKHLYIIDFNMLKNKFLLLPFLIFAIAFIIDKVLQVETIQTYYSKTVSEMNYFHKLELFEDMKLYLKQENHKKVLVVLGNSRSLLFDNNYIDKNYPDWILYNFSVPGGTPDYALYWIEKFDHDNVKVDFILLDSSPEVYNQTPFIKIDETLINGLDFSFIIRYAARYKSSDITNFLSKRMFGTYRYRPKLNTILERMKDDSKIVKQYRNWRKSIKDKLKKERGSASSDVTENYTSPPEIIKKFAEGDYRSYLTPYKFSKNMLIFHKDNVRILKKMGIPHAIVWVKVAKPYYELVKTKTFFNEKTHQQQTVYDLLQPELESLSQESKVNVYNMNDDLNYNCEEFSDASHMANACFPAYTDYIFKIIIQR